MKKESISIVEELEKSTNEAINLLAAPAANLEAMAESESKLIELLQKYNIEMHETIDLIKLSKQLVDSLHTTRVHVEEVLKSQDRAKLNITALPKA